MSRGVNKEGQIFIAIVFFQDDISEIEMILRDYEDFLNIFFAIFEKIWKELYYALFRLLLEILMNIEVLENLFNFWRYKWLLVILRFFMDKMQRRAARIQIVVVFDFLEHFENTVLREDLVDIIK